MNVTNVTNATKAIVRNKELTHSSFNLNKLPLRKNFTWTLVGNLVYAGCQWGMLVVLAKLGSQEMVGQFALGLAITAPVIMFFNLQLRAVQATDARQEFLFGDYFGLRLITALFSILLIFGIVLAANYRLETALVILIVGIAKVVEAISDVFYGLFQRGERMDFIAKSMIIKGLISLSALGAFIYFTRNILWGTIGLAIIWALIFICYEIPKGALILKFGFQATKGTFHEKTNLMKIIKPRWVLKTLNKLAFLAFPMGLVMMLISVNSNIPRYFIEGYFGESELGIFAAIAYLTFAGGQIVSALGQSASPRLSILFAGGNIQTFIGFLGKFIGLAALIGSVGVLSALLFGREILTFFYRAEYAKRLDVLLILMVAGGIGYISSILGYGMTAARHFMDQVPLFALVAGTSMITCLLLIPTYGLIGAAISVLIAISIQLLGSALITTYAILSCLKRNDRK